MRNHLLAMFAVFLGAASSSQAAIWAGPVTNPANGHAYYVVTGFPGSVGTWSQARSEAIALGGDLVTINDADENAFVLNFVRSSFTTSTSFGSAFIGLQRPPGGSFSWVSGDALTYQSWAPGNPSEQFPESDYARMFTSVIDQTLLGTWRNVPDTSSFRGPGVVEIVPEPAVLTPLMAAGAAVLGRRARRSRLVAKHPAT